MKATAAYDPTMPVWVVNLSKRLRSTGGIDLHTEASWYPDYSLYPSVPVTLYLEGREAGHRFTVHSQADGGPEVTAAVTAAELSSAAAPAQEGGWMYGAGWNYFEVPAGSTSLTFSVGAGMNFWLTREADGGASALMVVDTSDGEMVQAWSLAGVFPDPPDRATMPVTFAVNYDLRGYHDFSVRQSDGYMMGWFTPSHGTGSISSWDDQGVANPLSVALLPAQVDPAKTWWLRDETTGEDLPNGQTEVLDGWTPMHTEPPPTPVLTVRVPVWREPGYINISPSPHDYGATLGEFPATAPSSAAFSGVDGMTDYTIESVTITIENHHPYNTSFDLSDGLMGGTYNFQGANADLRHWFGPTQTRLVNISSSRWDHELILRHPNGDSYPIFKHATMGNVSFTPSGSGWQTTYHYFDATANHHPELPWYMEDAATGERFGPNPSNAALINWIALPTPANLTGSLILSGALDLQWPLGAASVDGGFVIERQLNDNGAWVPIGTVAPSSRDSGDVLHFADNGLLVGKVHSYRVRHTYGERQSAPSNVVRETGWLDSDGDGLPDEWEQAWNLNPNNAADALMRINGLGYTAAQMFSAHGLPGVGGPPEANDWFLQRPLLLWQAVAYNENSQFAGYQLTWDGRLAVEGEVIVECEIREGEWIEVARAPAQDRYTVAPWPPISPEEYSQNAQSGQGPAYNEDFNYRLRSGPHTSNESVMKLRLMMHTARVWRMQPGFQEFGGEWTDPNSSARKYYNKAVWDYASTWNSTTDTGHGQYVVDPAGGHAWSSEYSDHSVTWSDGSYITHNESAGDYLTPWPGEGDVVLSDTSTFEDWSSSTGSNGNTTTVYSFSEAEFTSTSSYVFSDGGPWGDSLWAPSEPSIDQHHLPTEYILDSVVVPSWWPATGPTTLSDSYNGFSCTLTLSEEYCAEDFRADTLARMPAFRTAPGRLTALGGDGATWTEFGEFPRREEGSATSILGSGQSVKTSEVLWTSPLAALDLLKSEYQITCNDCFTSQPVIIAEFERENAPDGPLGPPRVVHTIIIEPGAVPGQSTSTSLRESDVTDSAAIANKVRELRTLPPVELQKPKLDTSGNETGLETASGVNIATWEKAYSGIELQNGFVDTDPDRFYVRVPRAAGTTLLVRVGTEGPDSAYNDDLTLIEMAVDPDDSNWWRSKAQILVSDIGDDQHTDNGAGPLGDNCLGDRTHLAQLGSKLRVQVTMNGASAITEWPVPEMGIKTVPVRAVILATKPWADGGVAATTTNFVRNDINRIVNERFAQAGIVMRLEEVEIEQPPDGVDLSDGMSRLERDALVSRFTNRFPSDMWVFYITRFSEGYRPEESPENLWGLSFRPDGNSIFVRTNGRGNQAQTRCHSLPRTNLAM